jgi:glycerophosphoryl diester phosphodiesterase
VVPPAAPADGPAPRRAGPLVLAHRAGNDLAALRAAEALGVEAIEADVRRFRGRVEVRHLKTIGPVPIYWDRWRVCGPRTPILDLDTLLGAVAPTTLLMLDLKGFDRRLGRAVLAALDRHPDARVTLCARHWRHLAAFHDRPDVRLVRSVGSRTQLRSVRRLLATHPMDGISIHRRLLSPALVAELRERVPLVLSWPVNTKELADVLAGWGVNGLISDHPHLLGSGAGA